MFTDEQLIAVSNKVDEFLSTLAVEYQIPALELSAVILARLILLNNEFQNQKDFRNLLNAIKVLYNGLYRGEKYLVLIGTFLVILTLLLWVTKDGFTIRETPKPIILQGKY